MSNPKSDHPSSSPEHEYFSAVDETKQEIFIGKGNLMGYLCENDSGSDIFLSWYDAPSAASVTVGTTAPVFTQKILAGSAFGRDSDGFGYKWFSQGCVIAAVSTRNGAGAPAAPAVLETWSSRK